MSPHPAQQGSQQAPARQRRSRGELMRVGGVGVIVVLATLFAVLNIGEVKVDWIFGSGHAPLIIVIVLSVLVGVLLAYLAERLNRRRR